MAAGNCIGNGDYINAARKQATAIRNQAHAEAALNIALALWQRNSSKSIASMQQAIAKRNIKLSQELFDHAKKFWPCQKAVVDLAFGETKATIQGDALAAQYRNFGRMSSRSGEDSWLRDAERHCVEVTECDTARWKRFESALDADLVSFGDRQAEARAQSLNDRRYDRQLAALGLGKGIIRNVASFADVHGVAGLSAASLLGAAINSGTEAVGYHMRRDRSPRWDGVVGNARLPYETKPKTPKEYEVIVGTAKDEPIDVGCVEPSEYDRINKTQVYKDYLICKGLAKQ